MSAMGPGCVKKALYRHRAQNTASIGVLNAILLESIHRAPVAFPEAPVVVDATGPSPWLKQSLAQAAKASSRPATPRITITRLML
jgi:hypothetical protein